MFHERVHDAPLPVYYKAGEANRAKMLSITHQFLQIVQYFDPVCRHLVLVLPLCKYYREQVNLQSHNWSALLLGHPLDVPRRLIADLDRDQKRKLHYSLANALLEVEKSKDEQDIDKISLILETYSDFKVVQKSVLSVLCRLLEDEAIREKTQSSTLPGTLFSIIDKMEPEEGVTVKALFTVMLLLRPKGGAEGVLLRAGKLCISYVLVTVLSTYFFSMFFVILVSSQLDSQCSMCLQFSIVEYPPFSAACISMRITRVYRKWAAGLWCVEEPH